MYNNEYSDFKNLKNENKYSKKSINVLKIKKICLK